MLVSNLPSSSCTCQKFVPRKVRGALVAGYQFCITIGLLLASCVDYGTANRDDSGQFRIPIAIQFLWGIILGGGLLFLPDSPRFFVKRGRVEKARASLSSLRGQPTDSEYIEAELAEIIANEEYERALIPAGSWINGWANCFKGSLWKAKSNLRRTILGTSLQMMQQWTGVNFIFYYSTPFLQSTGAIDNTFLISLIFTLVNVCFDSDLLLHCREVWAPATASIWCLGHVDLPIYSGNHRCHCWLQSHLHECRRRHCCEKHLGCERPDCFYCDLHFLFRQYMGPGRMDCHWRDFPPANSLPWCRVIDLFQLAVEHHHCRDHALHGESGRRQPEVPCVLDMGQSSARVPSYMRISLFLRPRYVSTAVLR